MTGLRALLAVWRAPWRPAAPLTAAIAALRPRAMVWCGLGIVMLLTNMTLKGRPMLAVMTALVVLRALWLLVRFVRAQIDNDIAFWTADRIRAWEAGARDMAGIAAISKPASTPPAPLLLPARAQPVDPASCCCAVHHGERSVA